MHTLVLLGELDRTSAPALEAEIERLCEGGVVALALDLGGLTHLDATGVAVIVHRCGWCARHGCELKVLAETPLARSAFALAGAQERVGFATARAKPSDPKEDSWIQPLVLTAN
jgi:anti-anti-sigma factor